MDFISAGILKVSARAKEILVHKGNQEETESASCVADTEKDNKEHVTSDSLEIGPNEINTDDAFESQETKHSSPEYNNRFSKEENKDYERSFITGISTENVKDVSHKAVESAKSIGSFLYGIANKTGRSISETAMNLKQSVEQNTILGDFNKEQEAFLSKKILKSNEDDGGLPPWTGSEDEENVKQQILSLSSDKRNFLRSPPTGVLFVFSFDTMYPTAKVMLKEDPDLERMRFDLVPKLISEELFWRNYFYRVSLLKQSTRLTSIAQKQSNSGDLSTWSSKKSISDDSAKDFELQHAGSELEETDSVECPNHEFVSDAYQNSHISEDDIKEDMKLLGVTEKVSKVDEWEKELQQELQEYEVVAEENAAEDPAWESEIEQMFKSEKIKDIV